MDVQIVTFPETRVAAIEYYGSPALEHDTVRKLIAGNSRITSAIRWNIDTMVFITPIHVIRRHSRTSTSVFLSTRLSVKTLTAS